ncbi:MAG: UDP-forming cellulose synthase catalytic subunit [Hyphomicrobiaceae bacterium]|nr:UDP-forming cellulose synthase catalytic subunit [Hyphomicrobiaceae bacterium]
MDRLAATAFWLTATIITGMAVTLPVGHETQLVLSGMVVIGMLAIWKLRTNPVWRHVFLAMATFVVLRYVFWRTTQTLPSPDNLIDFIPGVLLYAAEMYCVIMLAISLFVVADPLKRPEPRPVAERDLPSVDVFVPTYNEDASLLATTLAAAKAMIYPADRLNVYLLDDGGTEQKCRSPNPTVSASAYARRAELQALCRELGAIYLTREFNTHAKAGNLNAGLGNTNGELVAVFDADHAPAREFLMETVGHFAEDPRLFLVQTPHFFLNPDPIEKNLGTFAKMPSENEMFYGVIQRGLDKWNSAFFCGSAALLRRSALQEAGGFSGISITEDCETALDLHSRGWNSRYVDKPLIAGLQPESFLQFIGQRSRWCQGMMQILMMKNPLFKSGLGIAQRIAYLSSMSFWLFPLARMAFVLAPLLFIFFNIKIYVANVQEFIAYTAMYMVVNVLLQNYLYGRVRWPWVSELYEYVQSIHLSKAILSVVLNPKKPTFNVTAKGVTLESDHLSELALPFFIMFGVLSAATVVAGWRLWAEPVDNELLFVVGLWNTLNLVVAGVALGVVTERRERRRTQRLRIQRRGELAIGREVIPVLIDDASIGGVRVRPLDRAHVLPRSTPQGLANLYVESRVPGQSPEGIPVSLRRVSVDSEGQSGGLQFLSLEARHFKIVADLMFGEAVVLDRVRQSRRTGKGVLAGSGQFIQWATREVTRGIRFAFQEVRQHRGSEAPAAPAPSPSSQRPPVADQSSAF